MAFFIVQMFRSCARDCSSTTADADIGVLMLNSTAAAAGAQQYSPMLVIEGQGWKTDATAATQEVQFGIQVVPVEGTANPTGESQFFSNINDGGFIKVGSIGNQAGVGIVSLGLQLGISLGLT